MPIRAYANGANVEVNVDGQVKKGQSVDILVDVKNVEKLYAASVDFIYDTELLKVESIGATDFITKYSNEVMELGGEVDKDGNKATYSFTFLGDKQGISGSGNLVTIKVTVISDGKLLVSEDNMKVKLVQRSGDSVENYPFIFVGYSVEDNNTVIESKPEDNNEQGNTNHQNKPDDNVDKEVLSNTIDRNNNNTSENSNETTDKQEIINKEDLEDNKTNSTTNNKDISNTNKDNKEEFDFNEVTARDSEEESRNNSVGYIIIGLLVLVGLGLCSYKICKNNNKK